MLQYVDTSALIAIISSRERDHKAAVDHFSALARAGGKLVMGRPVLTEFLDGVVKRIGKGTAIAQLDRIERSSVYRVEPDLDEDHAKARTYFLRHHDHEIDMTDSLSFAIAERLGIKEVFTFDSDFTTHGFTVRP